MKITLISLLLAAPVLAADAPKPAAAPKAVAAPKAEAKKAPAAPKDPFKNDDEREIYTIGYLMGRNLTAFSLSAAETKILSSGLTDSTQGATPKIDIRFYQPRVQELLQKRMAVVNEKLAASAEPEKAKGRAYTEKFVKENKPKAIPGGGWYLEQKAGTGATPTSADVVRCHYRGTHIDGTEFDSSYKRGAPSDFPIAPGSVIDCWVKGIPMMKVGGKATFVCPSDVAYKDAGRPGIAGGETLTFEVELVDIVKPDAPAKK